MSCIVYCFIIVKQSTLVLLECVKQIGCTMPEGYASDKPIPTDFTFKEIQSGTRVSVYITRVYDKNQCKNDVLEKF